MWHCYDMHVVTAKLSEARNHCRKDDDSGLEEKRIKENAPRMHCKKSEELISIFDNRIERGQTSPNSYFTTQILLNCYYILQFYIKMCPTLGSK